MDINQIYNKTTSYFKDGVKTKKKIFLKLNIMEHKNKTITLIDLFTHMGEAKLFNYISKYCLDKGEEYYFHHEKSSLEVAKELGIAPPTQFKYLSLLVKKQLLLKEIGKRGYYKGNPKFLG
jgi:hypothetical protein